MQKMNLQISQGTAAVLLGEAGNLM